MKIKKKNLKNKQMILIKNLKTKIKKMTIRRGKVKKHQ